MNDDQKKALVAWLNDAHAMEESLIKVLEKQIEDAEGHPDVKAQLSVHLEETKEHAAKVRSALATLGEEPSATKDALARMSATLNGLGMSMAGDMLVKEVHASHAAEHFEIASYMVIRAAAEACGQQQIVDMCDEIIPEEEAMGEWTREQIPVAVREHLASLA